LRRDGRLRTAAPPGPAPTLPASMNTEPNKRLTDYAACAG
jgi:hypothetical protein